MDFSLCEGKAGFRTGLSFTACSGLLDLDTSIFKTHLGEKVPSPIGETLLSYYLYALEKFLSLSPNHKNCRLQENGKRAFFGQKVSKGGPGLKLSHPPYKYKRL